MQTVSLKMDRRHIALLREQARTLGRSQAAIVRELIEEHLAPKKRPSLYERAKDLCGSVRGPRDLSTRPLTGYGREWGFSGFRHKLISFTKIPAS
jgi:predicted DNA-binding protein